MTSLGNYDPMELALASLRKISAAEFEYYRAKIRVVSARIHRITGPVCTEFTGTKGERIWRIDTLDGSQTHYFVPFEADVYL